MSFFTFSLFKTALFPSGSRFTAIFSHSASPVVFGGGSQTGPKNLSGTFSCTIGRHAAHKMISSVSSSAIFTSELRFAAARDYSDNVFEMWSKTVMICSLMAAVYLLFGGRHFNTSWPVRTSSSGLKFCNPSSCNACLRCTQFGSLMVPTMMSTSAVLIMLNCEDM